MSISEALRSLERVLSATEASAQPVVDLAIDQLAKARAKAQGLDPDAVIPGDPFYEGAAQSLETMATDFQQGAHFLESEYVHPARAIAEGLGELQEEYESYRRQPTRATRTGLAVANSRLDGVAEHFSTHGKHPTRGGQLLEPHLPQLARTAMDTVDAGLQVEAWEKREAARQASLNRKKPNARRPNRPGSRNRFSPNH